MNTDMLTRILAPLDAAKLECDGMTRVIHWALKENGVPHTVHYGRLGKAVTGPDMIYHVWINLGDEFRIDLRARMWLRDNLINVPHGVFKPRAYPDVMYINHGEADFVMDKSLATILSDGLVHEVNWSLFANLALSRSAPIQSA